MTELIYKFGTGDAVPSNAIYLTTIVETTRTTRFVWHYFLVEMVEADEELSK